MAPTELLAAGAAAVIVPAFAGGLLSKIPGGAIGQIALGAGLIYVSGKTQGMAKGVLVGTAAGIIATNLVGMFVKPSVTATA